MIERHALDLTNVCTNLAARGVVSSQPGNNEAMPLGSIRNARDTWNTRNIQKIRNTRITGSNRNSGNIRNTGKIVPTP